MDVEERLTDEDRVRRRRSGVKPVSKGRWVKGLSLRTPGRDEWRRRVVGIGLIIF